MSKTETVEKPETVETESAPVENLKETKLTMESLRKQVNEQFDILRLEMKEVSESAKLAPGLTQKVEKVLESVEKELSKIQDSTPMILDLEKRISNLESHLFEYK